MKINSIKESARAQKNQGFGLFGIKLPKSITVKPANKKLSVKKNMIKTQNIEVIQLSDSDSGDDIQFAEDSRDFRDEESRSFNEEPKSSNKEPKSSVQNKIRTRSNKPAIAKLVALRQFRSLKCSELELTEVSTFGPQIRPTNSFGASTRVIVTCDLCSYQTHKGYFANHFHVAHITPVTKTIKCDQCPLRFKHQDRLIFHQNFKHPNRDEFLCPNCYSKFSSIELMKIHQRNFRCYKRLFVRSVQKSQSVKVLCPICGQMIEDRKMNVHIRRKHSSGKKYKCSVGNFLNFI